MLPKAPILTDDEIRIALDEAWNSNAGTALGTGKCVSALQLNKADAHYQAEHQRVLDTLFTEANLNEFGYYQVSKNMILSLKSGQSPEGV